VNAFRLLASLLVLAVALIVTGCPGSAGTPSSGHDTAQEDPAIKEAKAKEDGKSLTDGEEKEVQTGNGVVIVSKDKSGKVTYRKK
jgi:hypothetical protein